MNKKAQGMSLNVIIVAALALIVLVVLTAIFIGRLGSFEDTVPKEAAALVPSIICNVWEVSPWTCC